MCLHSPSPSVVVSFRAAAAAVSAAADVQMRVCYWCPSALGVALDWRLRRCPGLQGPRPPPRRAPRWGIGQGQAYTSCMLSIMISRCPAGLSRPSPVHGPAPGPSCLVRRWVRPRPAAKPAAQRKAAREPAPTARPAPATKLRLVLALRPVRAWVLLFTGRVYKHGASIYEMRTGTCMCRSAHKTRTHMIR